MSFKYRDTVLSELARHGAIPRDDTPPELVYEFINDLYRFEIRALRRRMKEGLIPKSEYARHVERLRGRYPLLSLPPKRWVEP